MEVKLLSRKMIKPKIPTPDHLRTYNLSFFDQYQGPVHIPSIYFYNSSSGSSNTLMSEKLGRLEASLSDILSRFYPLAGRFSIDGLTVNCTDQGVEYIEAEVTNVTLAEFLSKAQDDFNLLTSLVPSDIRKATLDVTPIYVIQVSMFNCGGLVICHCCTHLLFDGFSASTFFREWSVACRAGIDEVMSPNFGMASTFPARDLSGLIRERPAFLYDKNMKILRKRFLFHENTISDIKSKVRADSGHVMINPSRLEVVACAIWKVLISIDQAKHGSFLRDSILGTSANLRGRTGIKVISENVLGNFYLQIPIRFKWGNIGTKMEDLELHHLVSLFANTLKGELLECSKISDPNELVAEVGKKINFIREEIENQGVDVTFLTSSCKLPMYEVDFGWGRPEWICSPNVLAGMVVLADSKCGTKIEATVGLSETDMHGFENHPDIVAFTSPD